MHSLSSWVNSSPATSASPARGGAAADASGAPSPSSQSPPLFTVVLTLAAGRVARVDVRAGADPRALAAGFCAEHGLGDASFAQLAAAIEENMAAGARGGDDEKETVPVGGGRGGGGGYRGMRSRIGGGDGGGDGGMHNRIGGGGGGGVDGATWGVGSDGGSGDGRMHDRIGGGGGGGVDGATWGGGSDGGGGDGRMRDRIGGGSDGGGGGRMRGRIGGGSDGGGVDGRTGPRGDGGSAGSPASVGRAAVVGGVLDLSRAQLGTEEAAAALAGVVVRGGRGRGGPPTVTSLDLSFNDLDAVPPLPAGVEALDVSFNMLRSLRGAGAGGEYRSLVRLSARSNFVASLDGLARAVALVCLDVACNAIESLLGAGLEALRSLRTLDVSGNLVGHASLLAPLAGCGALVELRVAGNPFARSRAGRAAMLELLPRVLLVDGRAVRRGGDGGERGGSPPPRGGALDDENAPPQPRRRPAWRAPSPAPSRSGDRAAVRGTPPPRARARAVSADGRARARPANGGGAGRPRAPSASPARTPVARAPLLAAPAPAPLVPSGGGGGEVNGVVASLHPAVARYADQARAGRRAWRAASSAAAGVSLPLPSWSLPVDQVAGVGVNGGAGGGHAPQAAATTAPSGSVISVPVSALPEELRTGDLEMDALIAAILQRQGGVAGGWPLAAPRVAAAAASAPTAVARGTPPPRGASHEWRTPRVLAYGEDSGAGGGDAPSGKLATRRGAPGSAFVRLYDDGGVGGGGGSGISRARGSGDVPRRRYDDAPLARRGGGAIDYSSTAGSSDGSAYESYETLRAHAIEPPAAAARRGAPRRGRRSPVVSPSPSPPLPTGARVSAAAAERVLAAAGPARAAARVRRALSLEPARTAAAAMVVHTRSEAVVGPLSCDAARVWSQSLRGGGGEGGANSRAGGGGGGGPSVGSRDVPPRGRPAHRRGGRRELRPSDAGADAPRARRWSSVGAESALVAPDRGGRRRVAAAIVTPAAHSVMHSPSAAAHSVMHSPAAPAGRRGLGSRDDYAASRRPRVAAGVRIPELWAQVLGSGRER